MAVISIADAARLAGKDRRTIERHLKSGVLSYSVDATGRRVIDTSELMRVYGAFRPDAVDMDSGLSQTVTGDVSATSRDEGEKAAMRAHIATLERHIDELREEKRELRAQVVGLLEYRKPSSTPQASAGVAVPMEDKGARAKPSPVDLIYLLVGIASLILVIVLLWVDGYRPWFLL